MTTTEVDALEALGLSEIEARVYAFLVTSPPTTGYRVSHAIGKPTANTYKAIAKLEAQGAVLVDEGESRVCRAVPPEEFLSRLERSFRERRKRAEAALVDLAQPTGDDRIYALRSIGQVFERVRQMLSAATDIVLLDVFPGILAEIGPEVVGAAARGIEVAAKVYADFEAPGARLVREAHPDRALAQWPGEQLSLVVDGQEHLLALLSPDLAEVRQAIWSPSRFLSCMHHNHVAAEILHTLYRNLGPIPFPAQETMEEAVGITLLHSSPPGLGQLQVMFGPPEEHSISGVNEGVIR